MSAPLTLMLAGLATTTGTVNGVYPLWEQTGDIHDAGHGQVGFAHAQIGLGLLQFGTQPFLDLYGTVNAQAKAAVLRTERLRLALAGGLVPRRRRPYHDGTPENAFMRPMRVIPLAQRWRE